MTTDKRIQLDRFEDAVIKHLAENFRFSGEYLRNVPLKVGRHLFVQDMPSTDELVSDAKAASEEYDPEREPCVTVYTNPNRGILPSQSRGSRHEWILHVILRLSTVMEEAKIRLEELVEYFTDQMPGVYLDRYALKAVVVNVRPTPFQYEDSQQAYCEVQLRLFAVPRVTA